MKQKNFAGRFANNPRANVTVSGSDADSETLARGNNGETRKQTVLQSARSLLHTCLMGVLRSPQSTGWPRYVLGNRRVHWEAPSGEGLAGAFNGSRVVDIGGHKHVPARRTAFDSFHRRCKRKIRILLLEVCCLTTISLSRPFARVSDGRAAILILLLLLIIIIITIIQFDSLLFMCRVNIYNAN
jgi:hypothetical protein